MFGGWGRCRSGLPTIFQTCSIGLRPELLAGQTIAGIPPSLFQSSLFQTRCSEKNSNLPLLCSLVDNGPRCALPRSKTFTASILLIVFSLNLNLERFKISFSRELLVTKHCLSGLDQELSPFQCINRVLLPVTTKRLKTLEIADWLTLNRSANSTWVYPPSPRMTILIQSASYKFILLVVPCKEKHLIN